MREMRRFRLEVIAVSVALGIALAITLSSLGSRRYFPIVLGVMGQRGPGSLMRGVTGGTTQPPAAAPAPTPKAPAPQPPK